MKDRIEVDGHLFLLSQIAYISPVNEYRAPMPDGSTEWRLEIRIDLIGTPDPIYINRRVKEWDPETNPDAAKCVKELYNSMTEMQTIRKTLIDAILHG